MEFFTADLCDEHKENVQLLQPLFKNYGASLKCYGEIVTLKLDQSNHALIDLLKTKVNNKIAVVDVDAAYYAVVGENLMNFAYENGWKAIIINGYVRDLHATLKTDVALYALGTCPRKSFKNSNAQKDIELNFAGVTFKPNDHLYADIDGIIVSKVRLH